MSSKRLRGRYALKAVLIAAVVLLSMPAVYADAGEEKEAGKGHEAYQIIGDKKLPYSDRGAALKAIKDLRLT